MGVWDETCGLTNTPIGEREGAPCVLVLLDPSVEQEGLRRDWSFADQVVGIHQGRYNGYGGVDGVVPDRDEAAAILFHRDAWDACVAREGATDVGVAEASRKLAGKPPVPLLAEFVAVLNVADGVRRDVLSGLRFKGQQDDPRTTTYRFVADLAERHLPRTRKG